MYSPPSSKKIKSRKKVIPSRWVVPPEDNATGMDRRKSPAHALKRVPPCRCLPPSVPTEEQLDDRRMIRSEGGSNSIDRGASPESNAGAQGNGENEGTEALSQMGNHWYGNWTKGQGADYKGPSGPSGLNSDHHRSPPDDPNDSTRMSLLGRGSPTSAGKDDDLRGTQGHGRGTNWYDDWTKGQGANNIDPNAQSGLKSDPRGLSDGTLSSSRRKESPARVSKADDSREKRDEGWGTDWYGNWAKGQGGNNIDPNGPSRLSGNNRTPDDPNDRPLGYLLRRGSPASAVKDDEPIGKRSDGPGTNWYHNWTRAQEANMGSNAPSEIKNDRPRGTSDGSLRSSVGREIPKSVPKDNDSRGRGDDTWGIRSDGQNGANEGECTRNLDAQDDQGKRKVPSRVMDGQDSPCTEGVCSSLPRARQAQDHGLINDRSKQLPDSWPTDISPRIRSPAGSAQDDHDHRKDPISLTDGEDSPCSRGMCSNTSRAHQAQRKDNINDWLKPMPESWETDISPTTRTTTGRKRRVTNKGQPSNVSVSKGAIPSRRRSQGESNLRQGGRNRPKSPKRNRSDQQDKPCVDCTCAGSSRGDVPENVPVLKKDREPQQRSLYSPEKESDKKFPMISEEEGDPGTGNLRDQFYDALVKQYEKTAGDPAATHYEICGQFGAAPDHSTEPSPRSLPTAPQIRRNVAPEELSAGVMKEVSRRDLIRKGASPLQNMSKTEGIKMRSPGRRMGGDLETVGSETSLRSEPKTQGEPKVGSGRSNFPRKPDAQGNSQAQVTPHEMLWRHIEVASRSSRPIRTGGESANDGLIHTFSPWMVEGETKADDTREPEMRSTPIDRGKGQEVSSSPSSTSGTLNSDGPRGRWVVSPGANETLSTSSSVTVMTTDTGGTQDEITTIFEFDAFDGFSRPLTPQGMLQRFIRMYSRASGQNILRDRSNSPGRVSRESSTSQGAALQDMESSFGGQPTPKSTTRPVGLDHLEMGSRAYETERDNLLRPTGIHDSKAANEKEKSAPTVQENLKTYSLGGIDGFRMGNFRIKMSRGKPNLVTDPPPLPILSENPSAVSFDPSFSNEPPMISTNGKGLLKDPTPSKKRLLSATMYYETEEEKQKRRKTSLTPDSVSKPGPPLSEDEAANRRQSAEDSAQRRLVSRVRGESPNDNSMGSHPFMYEKTASGCTWGFRVHRPK